MSVLIHLRKTPFLGILRVKCFQPPLDISGELCVFAANLSSTSGTHISGKTCHWSAHTSYFSSTLLDGGSLASHSSQNVGRHSSLVSHHKRHHHGCFGRSDAQRSAVTALNPLVIQRCVLCRQGLSSSACQIAAKATYVSTKRLTNNAGKNSLDGRLKRA